MDVKVRRAPLWLACGALGACASVVYLVACAEEGAPASPEPYTPSGADASIEAEPYVCPDKLDAGYPACPTPPPSWQGEVKAIVAQYCGPCHLPGGDGISKGGDYNYATVAGFTGLTTILTDVHSCGMPPQGSPPLPLADWVTLLQWLGCDAPDN